MFDLIEKDRRAGHRKFTTVIISIAVHVVVIGAFIIVPLLYATDQLPTPKEVMTAFEAAPPAPPPPPPPPPPQQAAPPKTVATTGQQSLAPVEAPPKVVPQVSAPAAATDGVPGGVPGGIAGGVVGGTVGGIPEAPPPAAQAPVRVGGQIKAPDLIHRVDPQYPQIAQSSHVAGVVVLEATVDPTGRVQSVKVLRGNQLLNEAAINAVKQWRYSPLMLNGRATPFILTVTVNFALQ